MNNVTIKTERDYQKWPSWDVVYEWEDVLSKVMNCKIENLYPKRSGKLLSKMRKVSRKIGFANRVFNISKRKKWNIIWIMDARIYADYTYKNTLPIFLDFSVEMIDIILDATRNLPCFWVTSRDIYEELISKNCKNVYFEPLSISDKYITDVCPKKDIDVIQFGRKNMILHEYMMSYCESHKDVDYVYQTADGTLTYTSTKYGNLGKFDTRKEYMKLLSRARISLVSTPGIDKSKDFGGVDFVTPRFYESAAQYCHMIGRYTDNKESKIICLNEVCCNVNSYDEFEKIVSEFLLEDCNNNIIKYKSFLENNRTSKRAEQIINVLENILMA